VLPFKVSPSQVISLKTFDFAGLSMAEVGTGSPPISIVPPKATSNSAARALPLNHSQAEIYNLSGEPTTGTLSTADTQRLRNQKGYLPVSWMEARTQICRTLALMGGLCGSDHPIPVGWRRMLRQYYRVEARLMREMDTEVGPRLSPSLFIFNLQLILRDWFVEQTMTGQRVTIAAPDFGQYLKVFERQNNLHWLLSVTNIPSLLALQAPAVPFQNRDPDVAHRPVTAAPTPAGGTTSTPCPDRTSRTGCAGSSSGRSHQLGRRKRGDAEGYA
jgi:hypothetical protein